MNAFLVITAILLTAAALIGFVAWRRRDDIAAMAAARQAQRDLAASVGPDAPTVPAELRQVNDLDEMAAVLRSQATADGSRAYADEHINTVMKAAEEGPAALLQLLSTARTQATAAQRAGYSVASVPGPRVPSDFQRPAKAQATKKRKKRK